MAPLARGFIRSVRLERDEVPSFDQYPFCIPAVARLDAVDLDPSVTFLVGENGSGKSTLIEAVAVAAVSRGTRRVLPPPLRRRPPVKSRWARGAVFVALALLAACGGDAGEREPALPQAAPATTAAPSAPTTATSTTTTAPDRTPVAAGTPALLAEQLATAAATIADGSASSSATDAAGHLQQVAVRQLVAHPEWDAAVATLLPEAVRGAVAEDVRAGRELAALVRRPGSTLPAWRIEAPPPVDLLRRHYEEAAAATGVPWEYLAAVHLVETRMSRIDGHSSAGAQGPMQFLPSTWATYGEGDIDDDGDAILAAARFLAAHGAPADLPGALFRYNPTPRYVRSVTAYAERMRADPRALLGYHGWEVHYATALGDVWLRVGYDEPARRPVTAADVAG